MCLYVENIFWNDTLPHIQHLPFKLSSEQVAFSVNFLRPLAQGCYVRATGEEFGLNFPSIKDLACSQRGVIRGRGPCSSGRSFTSGPVCCIVRRLKPVCWKVFLLFHMIDLPPPHHPHPSFIHQPRMPNWSPYLSFSLDFSIQSVLSIYLHVSVSCLSLSLHFCHPPLLFHCFKSGAFIQQQLLDLLSWNGFLLCFLYSLPCFFLNFVSLFLSLLYLYAFHVLSLILVSDPLPLPVTVLEGHSWYNYSFWLSCRLTPGWPGPDAAPVCQQLLLLQLMRDA